LAFFCREFKLKTYLKEKLIRSLERREFIAYLSKLSLGTVAILKGGLVSSSELQKSKNIRQELDFTLPGKLGNPDLMLPMDPRLDHRIAEWLMNMNQRYPAQMPNVTMEMDYDQVLEFIDFMHGMVASTDKELFASMPAFESVNSHERSIKGDEGQKLNYLLMSQRIARESYLVLCTCMAEDDIRYCSKCGKY